MFALNRRKLFIRSLAIVGVIVAAITSVFFTLKKVETSVNAITDEGQVVTVTRDERRIYFSDENSGTVRFYVNNGNGTTSLGFCRNPDWIGPDQQSKPVKASKMSNSDETQNLTKLLIVIGSVDNQIANDARDVLFPTISDEDRRFGFIHIAAGYLNEGRLDFHELKESDQGIITSMITKAQNMISTNSDIWVMAQTYQLYAIGNMAEINDGVEFPYQDVVWVEDSSSHGSVKVIKQDKDTHTSTPQGGASLAGISFAVYNNAGKKIYHDDHVYNTYSSNVDESLIASGTTDSNGELTISNLPVGAYIVKETASNASYNRTATGDVTINITNGNTTETTFENYVKKGSLTVVKRDVETESCTSLGKAKLQGNKFTVYYNGVAVATKTIGDDCSVSFTGLPYGTAYTVKETDVSGTGYMPNNTTETFQITSEGESISKTFDNQVIRGGFHLLKTDTYDGAPLDGITFKVEPINGTLGSSFTVTTADGGIINTANNRLPYGDYRVTEQSGENNEYCYNKDASTTLEIRENNENYDLGTWGNNCVHHSIATEAKDHIDQDKYIDATTTAEITDVITYHIMKGKEYKVRGILMDKDTNAPLLIDNEMVEQTKDLRSDTDEDGTIEMVFSLDASAIAGKRLVVFERLFDNEMYDPDGELDTIGENGLVAKHTDIDDDDQSVNVVRLDTTATDPIDGDKFVKNKKTAQIEDAIDYCAKAGVRYIIKGIVMDKLTGKPLVIKDPAIEDDEGSTVEETIEFTPEENCGQQIMTFTFDAREVAGRELVVFERLYEAEAYDETNDSDETGQNGLVIKHTDIEDDSQSVTVISLDTIATDYEDDNKFMENGKKTTIKDVVHYCVKPNTDFRILGYLADRETDEALSINYKPIEEEVIVNSESGCGDVEMKYEFDSTKLAGHKIVVYNDLYLNHYKVLAHESPYDDNQNVATISYSTYARNPEDGTKALPIGKKTPIEDTVKYCLAPGESYVLKGIMMDKSTGKELMIDGETVSATYELTVPINKPCGEVIMRYSVDTTELGGKDIVIFDEVYHDDELILTHRDINNYDETVSIPTPPPDTGMITRVVAATEENHSYINIVIILPILGAAGYIIKRVITKRKSISF